MPGPPPDNTPSTPESRSFSLAGPLILVGLLALLLLFAMRSPALLAFGWAVLAVAGFMLAPLSGNIALAVRQRRRRH